MSLEHAALEFNNIRIITTISFAHFMMVIFVKLIKNLVMSMHWEKSL